MDEKEILKEKIKILYTSLSKSHHWYTGISIKRFLKKTIFEKNQITINNQAINAGRWSAYCHYSIDLAFENLLNKHQLDENKTVLVHPLLPKNLVEKIKQTGANITSFDIDKNNLNFEPKSFARYLIELKSKTELPDLIITFCFNGLYEETCKIVNSSRNMHIPAMVLVDNPGLNPKLIELFNILDLGSVIWNSGPSLFDIELNKTLDNQINIDNWYISWFIEDRTKSTPEYNLSVSHKYFEPIIGALFYLLIKRLESVNFFQGYFYELFAKNFVIKDKIVSENSARLLILENYPEIVNFAVPDCVFDIVLNQSQQLDEQPLSDFYVSSLQSKVKEIGDLANKEIKNKAPEGTVELPQFYFDRIYLTYFFYTVSKDYWIDYLDKQDYSVSALENPSKEILDKPGLNNAKFIAKYLVKININ